MECKWDWDLGENSDIEVKWENNFDDSYIPIFGIGMNHFWICISAGLLIDLKYNWEESHSA